MNVKELEIIYFFIEQFFQHGYRAGQQDAKLGKCLEDKDFKLSAARKLEIKTFLSKQQKRR